jgi:SAM-dependent methyltransferase
MSPDAPGWQLDELAHAGGERLDATYVAAYDEKSPTDWSDEIQVLRALGIDATSTVVDLGAGTGTFAKAIAPHVARVVAVDVSEPMVAEMRARGVEAVHAGFLSYEHQGRLPDAVFTRNALHHLPDFWKAIALERVARLLQPGGVLRLRDLVYSFEQGKRTRRSRSGSPQHPTIPLQAGRHHNSPSTSAKSTPPSPGCSSRCSSALASRSAIDG